jgi:hypothetical protein
MFTTKIDRPCPTTGQICLTGRSHRSDWYEQIDSNSISKNRFGKFKRVILGQDLPTIYIYQYMCVCVCVCVCVSICLSRAPTY